MNEIRMALLVPIITFLALTCVIWIQFYQEITGKDDGGSFKSIRETFEKKHPGLNKKISMGLSLFVSALLIFIFQMYILDFVYGDMQVTQGQVVEIEHHRALVYWTISLDTEENYVNWFNVADIVEYEHYEIYYTPRSKTIVKAIKLK